MKKTGVVLILLIALLNFTACKKEKATVVNYEGLINFMSGDVKIIDNGKAQPAKIGDSIKQGMTIKTGPKSVVDVFFNENVVRILENSTVVMTELVKNVSEDKSSSEFYVENGKMFSKVTRKLVDGEKFRVNTPTSVAGVRGTEFMVEEDNGKSTVSCIEGVVVVKESGSDDSSFKEVEAGKEASVEKGKLSVADLKEKNRDKIRKIKDDIKQMREDIRKRFEEKKAEIKEKVKEMKDENQQRVEDQKAADQQRVEDQKTKNQDAVDQLKGSTDIKKEEIQGDVGTKKEEQSDAVKNFDKPDIKKFKSTVK